MIEISKLIKEYDNFENLTLIKLLLNSNNINNAFIKINNNIFTINHDKCKIYNVINTKQYIYNKLINFNIIKNEKNLLVIEFIQ